MHADQRAHRRVEFFMVDTDSRPVPVWVFKPADAGAAHAGLVLNLSQGGLQVLTPRADPLADAFYDVQLLTGEDDGVARFHGRAERLWSRDGDAGLLNGLRFVEPSSTAEAFIRTWQAGARGGDGRWVRCLLLAQPLS